MPTRIPLQFPVTRGEVAGAGALFLVDLVTPLLVIAFGNELAGEATHP